MVNKVNRVDFPSTQIEIRNKIAGAIENGAVKPGEKLPSYGSVAFDQRCSTGNVVNAYKILEAEGYIKKVHNRFVVIGPKKNIKTNVTEIKNSDKRPGNVKVEKTKRQIVEEWNKAHPDGDRAECAKETGIKVSTVRSYWKGKARTNSEEIKLAIIKKIESGEYKYGSAIPTSSELIAEYKCSETTMMTIFKELRSKGYIIHEGNRMIVVYGDRSQNKTKKSSPKKDTKQKVVLHEPIISKFTLEDPGFLFKKNTEFTINNYVSDSEVRITKSGKNSFVIYINRQ